jgi:hypothetical protein
MPQAVTALSPSPITLPACSARPPVNTTATAQTTVPITSASVTPTRTGRLFQIGRPSSIS